MDAIVMKGGQEDTETVIRADGGWFDLDLGAVWRYRDLIGLMVRRDFVAQYAQTALGPLWVVLQPLLTTLAFTLVFGRVAGLPTDGVPPTLFYMTGVVGWSYFASCITRTATTFTSNAHIFGKVWFPRLVVPVSTVISALVSLGIQLGLLAVLAGWEAAGGRFVPTVRCLWALPLLVLQMGVLGMGFGIVVSSLTIRYRDLANLVAFGVQLWMYASPVVYPASRIPERWQWIMFVNPVASVIEAFRLSVLGTGSLTAAQVLVSGGTTLLVFGAGVLLFSRVEKSFMDTV